MRTHRTVVDLLIRSAAAILLGVGLALILNPKCVAGEVQLEEISTRTDVYRNVTVTGHSKTDIFIVHDNGMANVKIADLDADTLWRVGLGPEPNSTEALAAQPSQNQRMPAALARMFESAPAAAGSELALSSEEGLDAEALQALQAGSMEGTPPDLSQALAFFTESVRSALPALIGAAAVAFLFYLFMCFCLRLIVKKTGTSPGALIWLPVLQLIPMLRAARMPLFWFSLWISPFFVGAAIITVALTAGEQAGPLMGLLSMVSMGASLLQLVAFIMWSVKIVQARGKHFIWAIFLILPLTNIIAFFYLAFSSDENAIEPESDFDSDRIVVHSAFSEA